MRINKAFIVGLIVGGLAGIAPGFMLGVYFLPILVAEEGASVAEVAAAKEQAVREGIFRKNLPGSDAFHWGEGTLVESMEDGQYYFTLEGSVAPGPNYKLYLTPEFVDTEEAFLAIKDRSVLVASLATFDNFRVSVPAKIDPDRYPAVIIWCERFKRFITAATLMKL